MSTIPVLESFVSPNRSFNQKQTTEPTTDPDDPLFHQDFPEQSYNRQDDDESNGLLRFLPAADLVMENKTSEPRDILMTERTTLSWVKFSTVLSLASMVVLLNYRIDTSADRNTKDPEQGRPNSRYAIFISCLFAVMSLLSLVLAGYNYFKAIYNYKDEKIETFDNKVTSLFLFICVLVLLGANLTFIILQD